MSGAQYLKTRLTRQTNASASRSSWKNGPTDENTADIFTKILSRQPFEKHRRTLLNLAAMD